MIYNQWRSTGFCVKWLSEKILFLQTTGGNESIRGCDGVEVTEGMVWEGQRWEG